MCDRKKGNCEMGSFSVDTKSHGWVATIQEANMIKAGLSEEQYKNPRNLCSGSVRQLNNEITAHRRK